MDSLYDILANKDFALPDEVKLIKSYVAKTYRQDVNVAFNHNEIIISSRSAGLISNLRLNSPELIQTVNTDKKIRFIFG
jgi:hypothetical protein